MKKILAGIFIVALLFIAGMLGLVHLFPDKVVEMVGKSERGKANLELKSVVVGDIEYKYLEGGKGDPLVLVHGFGANKDNWTRVAKYLTPHFRVVALDLAGYGESSRNFKLNYTISAQADRLYGFVKALGLTSFHLGGSSMGGAISGTYASKHSDMVKSLWLVAPGSVLAAEESEFRKLLNQGKNPLIAKNAEEYKALMDFVFFKRPYVPSPVLDFFTSEAVANKPMNDKVFADIVGEKLDLEKRVQGIGIPTLVLWGDQDRVLHVSGAEILCRAMANATCVIMKNAGHLPMIERPEEASRSFLKFHNL